MDSKFFKIGDIFNVEKGLVQSSKNIEGQFNFITASAEWKTHNEYSHDCEALVFAAGAAGSLGRTHYVNGKFIASDLCFVLTLKDELIDKVDMKFYFYYFNLNKDTIVKSIATGTSKLAINMRNFINYCIPLPSIEYQKLAREKIEEVEPRINKLNLIFGKNLDYITRLRHSILLEAIQGKLVPQDPNDEPVSVLLEKIKKEKEMLIKEGKIKKEKPLPPITQDEIPFEIPKGWKWVYINDIAFVTKLAGFEYTKYLSTAISNNGDVPIIRANNIKMNKFIENTNEFISYDLSEKLNRSAVYKKCLLMTFIGAGIGEVAIFNKNTRFHLAPNVAKIELFNNFSFNIHEKYILYYLMSEIGQNEIFRFQKATAQPSLSMETIRKVRIPIPPLNEQKRIVEKVDQLMALCDELEKNIEQAKKDSELLMQSVLREAFNDMSMAI